MLLIGQPKSASTSLAVTIGKITGLNVVLGIPRKPGFKKSNQFTELFKYHNNVPIRNKLFLKQVVTGKRTLFKEHLLPIQAHFKELNKYKNERIVILLREPEDSLDSYYRLFKNHHGEEKAKEMIDKLSPDIFSWHERWMYWKSVHKNVMIVEYRDLVLNYQTTIKKILKHYRFKVPKKILPLQKLKYTGVGEKRLCS